MVDTINNADYDGRSVRDIVIEMHTDMKWLKKKVSGNCNKIEKLDGKTAKNRNEIIRLKAQRSGGRDMLTLIIAIGGFIISCAVAYTVIRG